MTKVRKTLIEKQLCGSLCHDVTVVPNLLLRHYEKMGLAAADLISLLQALAACSKDSDYFNLNDILPFFVGNESQAAGAMLQLEQKGFLEQAGEDKYSICPLYNRLLELLVYLQVNNETAAHKDISPTEKNSDKAKPDEAAGALFKAFEREFARPLSPTEIDKIIAWIKQDKWPVSLIKEALCRAVLYGSLNFVYIDRILQRWQREGIRTEEDLARENKVEDKKKVNKPKSVRTRNSHGSEGLAPMVGDTIDYSKFFSGKG